MSDVNVSICSYGNAAAGQMAHGVLLDVAIHSDAIRAGDNAAMMRTSHQILVMKRRRDLLPHVISYNAAMNACAEKAPMQREGYSAVFSFSAAVIVGTEAAQGQVADGFLLYVHGRRGGCRPY